MHAASLNRTSHRALALAVAATVFTWLAFASPVSADAPGANGTVKIHEAPEHKNGSVMANDPKVCDFVIHGFNFDAGQTGRWWIQPHPWGSGDPSQQVREGTYEADADGNWSAPTGTTATEARHTSSILRLEDGHYKLYVEARTEPTTYKHKVFKIECNGGNGGDNAGNGGNGGDNAGNGGNGGDNGGNGGNNAGNGGNNAGNGGAVAGGGGGPGGSQGGVLGGSGGPGGGSLPDTAMPAELAGSLGGLLVIASGIGFSLARRRTR